MSPTPFAAGCAVQAEGAKESLMKEDKPALADPERFKNWNLRRANHCFGKGSSSKLAPALKTDHSDRETH